MVPIFLLMDKQHPQPTKQQKAILTNIMIMTFAVLASCPTPSTFDLNSHNQKIQEYLDFVL